MANHLQAEKRNRQRIKKTVQNRHFRSTMRSSIKRLKSLLAEGNGESSKTALATAVRLLDKAVTKGIVRRETASRTISRLTIAVQKITQ